MSEAAEYRGRIGSRESALGEEVTAPSVQSPDVRVRSYRPHVGIQPVPADGGCLFAPWGWLLAGPLALSGPSLIPPVRIVVLEMGQDLGHGVDFPHGVIFLPSPNQNIIS